MNITQKEELELRKLWTSSMTVPQILQQMLNVSTSWTWKHFMLEKLLNKLADKLW